MTRFYPLLILVAGLGLAAASGSRNGDRVTNFRKATWSAEHAEGEERKRARSYVRERGLPAPGLRMKQWFDTGGYGFGGGVLLILIGAGLARRQQQVALAGGSGQGRVDFVATLDALEAALVPVGQRLADLPMDDTADDVREALDRIQSDVIEPLVDGRGQLSALHGMAAFAAYFSPFSAGERQLNRCWSALTDGHAVVARSALEQARGSFSEARAAWGTR